MHYPDFFDPLSSRSKPRSCRSNEEIDAMGHVVSHLPPGYPTYLGPSPQPHWRIDDPCLELVNATTAADYFEIPLPAFLAVISRYHLDLVPIRLQQQDFYLAYKVRQALVDWIRMYNDPYAPSAVHDSLQPCRRRSR